MKIDILGIKIDNLAKPQMIDRIRTLINASQPIFVVTPYSEFIVRAQKDAEFKNILNAADVSLPDGIGILWAAKYLDLRINNRELRIVALIKTLAAIIFNPKYIRQPIPEKISGSEFIWDLAEFAAKNNKSIFLLGGYGDTAKITAEIFKNKFPNLRIAGTLAPSSDFSLPLERGGKGGGEIINQINSSNADFLFVALGPVRQEKWIYENLPKLRVKLAIGLGGTFDYIAGKQAPAPQFWRQAGLEWLWRLVTQPRRFSRIVRGVFGLIYYIFKSG